MALAAGAGRVTACESVSHLAETSRRVIAANQTFIEKNGGERGRDGERGTITVLQGRLESCMTAAAHQTGYDVVVAELADSMGLGEGPIPVRDP